MNRTIERKRVRSRIWDALTYRVTVLRAPAGFGKSTALQDAIDHFDRAPVVRYTLGANVDSAWTFVRGLASALQNVSPSVRLSLAGAWERAADSPVPEEHLARWLYAHVGAAPLTIVVDQLHHAAANAFMERLLARLVDLCPPEVRWVYSLRTDADLPIPRWLADGTMALPIDSEVLRFNDAEIALAASQCGRSFSDAQVAEIARRTAGWPMGVMFALRDTTGARALMGSGTGSYAVLAESIFHDRTEREREFLLVTSLLPQLDVALCRAAGFGDAPQLLKAMERDAGFIFAANADAPQYHDSLAGYLQGILRSRGAMHFDAVLAIAASALEELGRLDEALNLVTKYELRSEIARLLDRYGLRMMQNGDGQTLQTALALLGEPADGWSGQTLALKSIVESRAGKFDTSDAWMRSALEQTENPLRAEIAYRCASEMLQRRRATAIELLEPYSADAQAPLKTRVSILSALGSAYMQAGDSARARACIKDALALGEKVDDPSVLVPLDVRGAYVLLYSGDRDAAKDLALRGAQLATQSAQFQMACAAYSTLYAAAADEDEPLQCLQYLSQTGR